MLVRSALHSAHVRIVLWWGFDVFFFQAEDGIRGLVRSRGLGNVYKRQTLERAAQDSGETTSAVAVRALRTARAAAARPELGAVRSGRVPVSYTHLTLPTKRIV